MPPSFLELSKCDRGRTQTRSAGRTRFGHSTPIQRPHTDPHRTNFIRSERVENGIAALPPTEAQLSIPNLDTSRYHKLRSLRCLTPRSTKAKHNPLLEQRGQYPGAAIVLVESTDHHPLGRSQPPCTPMLEDAPENGLQTVCSGREEWRSFLAGNRNAVQRNPQGND